jgi:hypothetical protein
MIAACEVVELVAVKAVLPVGEQVQGELGQGNDGLDGY